MDNDNIARPIAVSQTAGPLSRKSARSPARPMTGRHPPARPVAIKRETVSLEIDQPTVESDEVSIILNSSTLSEIKPDKPSRSLPLTRPEKTPFCIRALVFLD